MQFQQHQGHTRITLELRDDEFLYDFRQGRRHFSDTFPYHGWPFEGEAFQERTAWLCWAGWLSTAIGVLVGSASLAGEDRLHAAGLWFLTAFGLHALCARRTRHFSRFMVGPFPLLLLRDAHHDTVVAELARRRTACLRRYLLEPLPRPRPEVHQRRLDWLLASGVITDAEYQQASHASAGQGLPDARRA